MKAKFIGESKLISRNIVYNIKSDVGLYDNKPVILVTVNFERNCVSTIPYSSLEKVLENWKFV